MHIYPVHDARIDLRRARQAHTEREVVQPRDADSLAVHALKDTGNRRQKEVHEPIDERHVHPERLHDRLAREECEWAHEGLGEDVLPGAVGILNFEGRPDRPWGCAAFLRVGTRELFAHASGLALEQQRRERYVMSAGPGREKNEGRDALSCRKKSPRICTMPSAIVVDQN